VITVDGKFGSAVTGTMITVDGTQTDGTLTVTDDGTETVDGNWVTWIAITVLGKTKVDWVGGKVDKIEAGTTIDEGMWITVTTVDGNDGSEVTGTMITVDGTQTDGILTVTDDGTVTLDGNWVTWITITVLGNGRVVWVGGKVDKIEAGT